MALTRNFRQIPMRRETADPAASRDNAMARHNECERIPCKSLPHGAGPPRWRPPPSRGRHRSWPPPTEWRARPHRRGGGMGEERPCRAGQMRDRLASRAEARRAHPEQPATSGGGTVSSALGNRWSTRLRVFGWLASGSCTPTTPRALHATAQRPTAVSKCANKIVITV